MLVVCTRTFGHSFKAATTDGTVCTAKMMKSNVLKQPVIHEPVATWANWAFTCLRWHRQR